MCLDTEESAGNMGLLDQVMALRWVQKYIKSFGGNNNDVTIFGQSAGSASVNHLILSPLTSSMEPVRWKPLVHLSDKFIWHLQKLFHRAIGQSGSAIAPWAFDTDPVPHVRNIAEKLNCNHDNVTEIAICMRENVTARQITKASKAYVVRSVRNWITAWQAV